MIKRCVSTVAVGKPYYHTLAINLLRTFILWNSNNDIHFLLLTDNELYYTQFASLPKVKIKQIAIGDTNASFTSKLKLAENIIAEENLFIDCDCLIYHDLDHIFNYFSHTNFSAIGNSITNGNFFCDVASTLKHFNIAAMPKFVGSVYYYKKNEVVNKIFDTAIKLRDQYDQLNFVRLRNAENEEPLLAVAMALNNETVLANDGSIKADAMFYRHITCNVSTGLTKLTKPLQEIAQNEIIPPISTPAIIHFNASFSESFVYKSDIFRLNHPHYHSLVINSIIFLKFKAADYIQSAFKKIFRPVYHLIFGFRKIKKGHRV